MSTPEESRPPFVPDDFAVPRAHAVGEFRLVPLGPQHNAGDYEAWTSSMEHIAATPGPHARPGSTLDEGVDKDSEWLLT